LIRSWTSRRRDSVSTEAATSTSRSGRFIVRLANVPSNRRCASGVPLAQRPR
jgi:hypothetical protein